MRQLVRVLLCVVATLGASGVLAGGFEPGPGFTGSDFEDLADALADAVGMPNLGTAAAGGLTGFEVLLSGGGPQVDEDAHYFRHGVDGSTTGGLLLAGRVIARKGLPARLDVGAQVGTLLGERFLGGEVRWALLPGGALEPAAALRATYSSYSSGSLDLTVAEAQLVLSKGFAVLSPYAAGGYRRVEADASFGAPAAQLHEVTQSRFTLAVGVRALLPPLRIVAEARQGARRGFYVGFGVGL